MFLGMDALQWFLGAWILLAFAWILVRGGEK